jgi:hypothetical protein
LSREEDLTKGILSTHLHSEGQHAEELIVHQEWEAVGLQIFWQTMIQMMKVISVHERTVRIQKQSFVLVK